MSEVFKISGIAHSPDIRYPDKKVVTAYPVAHKVLSDVTLPLFVANGIKPS